ncbi:MAG: hypothetical protein STSR0009_24130 [Methanoregula sp.]
MLVPKKILNGYPVVIPVEIRQSCDLVPQDILQGNQRGSHHYPPAKNVTLKGIYGMICFGGDAVTDKKRIQSDEG